MFDHYPASIVATAIFNGSVDRSKPALVGLTSAQDQASFAMDPMNQ